MTEETKVPLSEDLTKITADWTAQQCIDELRRIAEIDPEKFISRNYFRVHSRIAESVWSRHFGTFSEYKRQANVQLSRHQHQHERNIAKHASVDHYRKLGADRENWGEKYVREQPGRFKTLLVASDLHDKEIDPFFLRVLIDTATRAQPDVIVLNGDIFDFRGRLIFFNRQNLFRRHRSPLTGFFNRFLFFDVLYFFRWLKIFFTGFFNRFLFFDVLYFI